METDIEYKAFSPDEHLSGVLALCDAEGWNISNLSAERASESFTAPGVHTEIAVHEGDNIVGFAKMQSDGVLQAHLSAIAVDEAYRGRGVGKRLVAEAFESSGGERVDLISTEGSEFFYESFDHRTRPGYRIYPRFGRETG